jgi:hypothetical protein
MILCISSRKRWFRKGDVSIHRGIQKDSYTEYKHTCTLLAEREEGREKGKGAGQPTVSWEEATVPNRDMLRQHISRGYR